MNIRDFEDAPRPPHEKIRLLVVDADREMRLACFEMAEKLGYQAQHSSDLDEARAILYGGLADILLLHLPWGTTEAIKFVAEVKLMHPEISIVVMTGSTSVNNAVEAMRCGATDYLTKPFQIDDLSAALERATRDYCSRSNPDLGSQTRRDLELRKRIVGRGVPMERIYQALARIADIDHPVLILGESGTGKEMVARSLHRLGSRSSLPFLPVECSSLVPSLIEIELFGYVKGAFTGALRDKEGLLVSAHGGTVFLDEIGELSIELQAGLLRAIQEKEVRPVGSSKALKVNARIVVATNRDLSKMVEDGTFRKDLYHRLNVVNLKLPPLRKRKEDIPLLVTHFLNQYGRSKAPYVTLSGEAMRMLQNYEWPGNVRELENAIERACALVEGSELQPNDFPTVIREWNDAITASKREESERPEGVESKIQRLEDLERNAIIRVVRETNGNKLQAAELLGIGKTTLYRKLHEYGIADQEPDRDEEGILHRSGHGRGDKDTSPGV